MGLVTTLHWYLEPVSVFSILAWAYLPLYETGDADVVGYRA